jgi:3-hydroxyisobutyrate dehydrogenase-like beta-hydroxyacid dehydrogenase
VKNAIAWLGLGHMGSPMARRLLDHGHQMIVWNRSPQRAQPLAEAGARVAQSPAAAAGEADVVITMLSDPDALDGVLFGENGAVNGLRPGSTLVEMSTIGPQAVRAIAGKLPRGIDMVDAPVAGSTTAAMSGTLTVLAGGSAEVLDRVEPILSNLGTVRRCGELGSGQSLKLVVNTALLTAVAGLADALAVADAVGVAREMALEALNRSAGQRGRPGHQPGSVLDLARREGPPPRAGRRLWTVAGDERRGRPDGRRHRGGSGRRRHRRYRLIASPD